MDVPVDDRFCYMLSCLHSVEYISFSANKFVPPAANIFEYSPPSSLKSLALALGAFNLTDSALVFQYFEWLLSA